MYAVIRILRPIMGKNKLLKFFHTNPWWWSSLGIPDQQLLQFSLSIGILVGLVDGKPAWDLQSPISDEK